MTARFVTGEVLLMTCDIRGVVGHFRFAEMPRDTVPRQFVPEDKRMHSRDPRSAAEGSQFALVEGTGEFEPQTGFHIRCAARDGAEDVLGNVERHWHEWKLPDPRRCRKTGDGRAQPKATHAFQPVPDEDAG